MVSSEDLKMDRIVLNVARHYESKEITAKATSIKLPSSGRSSFDMVCGTRYLIYLGF
jgi:hypothetical protein